MTLIQELARELAGMQVVAGQRHTAPSGVFGNTTPYLHGSNGLWSYPGLERDIISTRVQPIGLAGAIPARPTNVTDPLFPYLTGFLPGSGTNPVGLCDEPPTAGPMKNCYQTAQFGRYSYKTRELELTTLARQQINRSEFLDLRIANDPLLAPGQNSNGIVVPGTASAGSGAAAGLAREALMRFVELGISFQNKLMRQVYSGNPANNTSGGGYREFPGLDLLIGTSKKDAITGQSCPSLNSLLLDYGFKRIGDTTAGADIVRTIVYMVRMLRSNAEKMGLMPATWSMAMRENMFYELTAAWPCSYLTYGCQMRAVDGTQSLLIDANDQIAMRDAMRQGKYLLIDGAQFPVVFDDAIDEDNNTTSNKVTPGSFASDIYFICNTFMGGMAGIYWEYLDYRNGTMEAVADGRLGTFYWTDGGQYFWHLKPPVNTCVQWQAYIEPRLIVPVPHLFGRLTNVQYTPYLHTRDPFPTDPYFVNGGVTSRSTAPSFYPPY
jgi:hypothetical protein